MNENNIPPVPPPIPPAVPQTPVPDPSESIPISNMLGAFEALLRQPRRVLFNLRSHSPGRVIGALLTISILCALIYGVVVGTFSGGEQMWEAPAKIALGMLISAFICLPSLYIFACISGSQARFVEVVGLVTGLLALMTILLIGFAPVAWVFSQSTESIVAMGVLHLLFWFIAICFGLKFLHNGFGHVVGGSRGGLRVWTVIFLLVVVQMTTALRPIIGTAPSFLPTEKKFFLAHWADCMKSPTFEASSR
jgi:hypothetical protein